MEVESSWPSAGEAGEAGEAGWSWWLRRPEPEELQGSDPALLRELRNWLTGSEGKKKWLAEQDGLLSHLSLLLSSPDAEARREASLILASLAAGSPELRSQLLAAHIPAAILQSLVAEESVPTVEGLLRCLHSLVGQLEEEERGLCWLASEASDASLQEWLSRLLRASTLSDACAVSVWGVMERGCSSQAEQEQAVEAGTLEAIGSSLPAASPRVRRAALSCLARLLFGNPQSAFLFVASQDEQPSLQELVEGLLGGDEAVGLEAARCLAYASKAGAIEEAEPVIQLGVVPLLMRALTETPSPHRRSAAQLLAFLCEGWPKVQRLCSQTRQSLANVAEIICLGWSGPGLGPNPSVLSSTMPSEPGLIEALLCWVAALSQSNEDVRRRISQQQPLLLDLCVKAAGQAGSLQLPSLRLLHSMSRSVEQLRTTFQDHSGLWSALLGLIKTPPSPETVRVASAILANLVLEFSPARAALLEQGVVEVMVGLTTSEDESLRLNGVWGLMNATYGGEEDVRRAVMRGLSGAAVRRLVSGGAREVALVLRALGLVRNLVSEGWEGDGWTAADVEEVVAGLEGVLEGDLPLEAKEAGLTALGNLAVGEAAAVLLARDELLKRVLASMLRSSPVELQGAAITVVSNLLSREDGGVEQRLGRLRRLGLPPLLTRLPPSPDPRIANRLKYLQATFNL